MCSILLNFSQAAGDLDSGASSPYPLSKKRLADEEGDVVDRFSMRVVSSLQGSTSLEDAKHRARDVLVDFKNELEDEYLQVRQKAERHLQANKVLAKALHILKAKLNESQQRSDAAESELDALRQRVGIAEDRAANAEHAVSVLRWHLQHGGSADLGPSNHLRRTPPDVF